MRKYLWLYVLCVLAFGAGMAAGYIRTTPKRAAEAQIYSVKREDAPRADRGAQEHKSENPDIFENDGAQENTPELTVSGYKVTGYNGNVALLRIYSDASEEVVELTHTPLGQLREEDQKLLSDGIFTESESKAAQILEDFAS